MKQGWFSKKAVDLGCGTSIYRTPTGEEVEVTIVAEDLPDTYFRDAVPVGPVVSWVRQGQSRASLTHCRTLKVWKNSWA